MLEQTEESVVAPEGLGLAAADVPLGDERVERLERSALADAFVGESVHELQQLHGELDITDAAGPEFELTVHLRGGDVIGDAFAHALHALDEVLARRAVPDQRLHRRDVLGAERGVARDRARLQQCLELPALRPARVVLLVRGEAAHQRALLALGAQVRVDLPQRRLDLGPRDAAHRLHREPRADVDRARLAHDFLVGRTADEDHVDVADVVQLARAGLAHRDDGEPGRRDLLTRERTGTGSRDARARDAERGFQCRSGEVGER